MNLIKKFRSANNRFKTNKPRTYTSGAILGAGSGMSAGTFLILAPLDGGFTAGMFGLLTAIFVGVEQAIGRESCEVDYPEYIHDRFKTISHNNVTYKVTVAQAAKHKSLEVKINSLKEKFNNHPCEKKRRQYEKKIQRLVDYQDDILDSKNVVPASQVQVKPELKISYKQRKLGN